MDRNTPSIILLAAGSSTRMGRWKHEELILGTPLIQHTLQRVTSLPYQVIVVGGYQFDKLQKLVAPFSSIKLVHNPHYTLGFVSSVQRGVQEVQGEDIFILPGDMPNIPLSIFSELKQALIHEGIRPVYQGVPGHPVLLRNRIAKDIMKLPEGESLRPFLAKLTIDTIEGSIKTVQDVDTPEDLLRLNSYK